MDKFGRIAPPRYRFLSAMFACICLLGLAPGASTALAATTLNVNTTADSSPTEGACASSSVTTAPGTLSLREAICLGNNISGEVTINIPSGTYNVVNGEFKVGVKPGLTEKFVGAGMGITVLDAQNRSRFFNVDPPGTIGAIKTIFQKMTMTNAACTNYGGSAIITGDYNNSKVPEEDELTIEEVAFLKNADVSGPTVNNQPGGAVGQQGGNMTIKNSTFVENTAGGSPGSALFYSNQAGSTSQTVRVSGTSFIGNYGSNATNSHGGYGGAFDLEQGKGSSEITESSFINNSFRGSAGDDVQGGAIDVKFGTLTVTRSNFIGNSVSTTGTGRANGAVAALWERGANAENYGLTLKYDRMVGNTPASNAVYRVSAEVTSEGQILPEAPGPLNATENWWGCNAGPGNAGCDGTSGTVSTTPRLQFRAAASPSTVVGPNGTSALNANFLTDSAGTTISAANLAAFNNASVTWSDPQPSPAKINGHAAPETTTTNFSGGQATATYNSSTASGSGHAVASFDNATVTIPLTADQKPVVTGNPSSQMVTPGSTVTFTASATGTPTPSVQWERNTGSGFAPISGATSTTYSFTAAKGETGYQFRATFKNTIEGTEYPATTTAATLTVGKAITTLATNASSAVIGGGSIHDTATLSGGSSPTGTITFKVFAPGDTTCTTALETSSKTVTGNTNYESAAFTPSSVGEYRWTAVYSGDANNEEAVGACNAANETSTVSKATPSISTQASEATIGGTIHDSATFSGGVTPGGTLTFRAYAPGDTTCTGTVQKTSVVNVTQNGSYESESFTPTVAGSYRWIASYSGDAKNAAVAGACNATNELSPVNKATPTLSTVASQSTTDGATIFDTATLGGAYNPGGTIVIKLFGVTDTNCSKAPLSTTTDTVTQNGEYQSAAYGPPFQTGEYRWTAVYSGDANNVQVVDPCNAPGETSTVGKSTPAISTTASNATLGEGIHDTATLSGGVNPGGTITFNAYGPGDTGCTATAVFTTNVNVTKNGSYESASFAPTAAGEYRWTAVYSGDANNKGATSACNAANETSSVNKAGPAISTEATDITVGGKIHDTATLSGGQGPGGTITFEAFGPADATCGSTAAFTKTVTVSGNGEYGSTDFEPKEAGTYRWVVTYSGDANNKGATSACNAANETSTVAQATPTIATQATDTTIGGEVHDTATIAGGVGPTGTITFRVFGPGDTTCSATVVHTSTVTVNANGSYESEAITPAEAGTYRWTAEYSGDGNNKAATSACNAANETSTVAQASPTISTAATDATLGNKVHDSATIAAGFNPGGTVTFKAFGPTDTSCSGTAVESKTVSVSGNGSYDSPDFKPATIGDYRWIASYSGDVNNEAATGSCNDSEETSTISKAVTSLGTSATNAAIGSAIHDTATLSGGQAPGGTITFKVYGPNDATCTGAIAETLTVNVSGNGTYGSGDYTPLQSGEYRWVASYSGDAENEGKAGSCGDSGETSVVAEAMPTITSEATDTTIGGEIEDTATIAGGQSPGGTITFEAFGVEDELCEGIAVFTKTVPVSGNGDYGSTGFTPEPAGTYQWVVSYSGDTNNTPAEAECGEEGETSTVAKDAPKLSSAATDATLGAAIHDTATLAGGHLASGTLTFTAYGPDDLTCTGPVAFSATLPVSGDGSYGSGDFTPAAAGEYRWVVAYSGDVDNQATAAPCGAAGESSDVASPPAKNNTGENPPANPIVPCMPPAPPTAGGYVPKTKVPTGLVPGVRARIHVGAPSNLEIAATLKYRLNGQSHSVDLGTSSLEDPGTRNLRVAIPAAVREVLPLGTKVHLALVISAVPAGSTSCTEAKQSRLGLKTKVVKVLLPR